MRLTEKQVQVIKASLLKYFGADTQIWLFGSRARDHERGGDIDLYLETGTMTAEAVIDAKIKALVAIKKQLGDQKIDMVIRKGEQSIDPIHLEAKQTGVKL